MLTLSRSAKSYETPVNKCRDKAMVLVNQIADEVRKLYITPIAGQEMIYLSKEQEAHHFLEQDPVPSDLSPYPFIASEVGATGETALDVATVFATKGSQWRALGSMIERLRIRALTDLKGAATEGQVAQILDEYKQDMDELR